MFLIPDMTPPAIWFVKKNKPFLEYEYDYTSHRKLRIMNIINTAVVIELLNVLDLLLVLLVGSFDVI